jgi:hypothetical protein
MGERARYAATVVSGPSKGPAPPALWLRRAKPASAYALLMACFGCSDRALPRDVGDADRPEVPADARPAGPGGSPAAPTCDLRTNRGCPSGDHCQPSCQALGPACTHASGAKGQDAVCALHEDCQAGFACVLPVNPMRSGGGQRCLRHCVSDRDCTGGTSCVITTLTCDYNDPTMKIELTLCQFPLPVRRDGGP